MTEKHKKDSDLENVILIMCFLCTFALIVMILVNNKSKNNEPPEYILIYEEYIDRPDLIPSFDEMFPHTERYSLNGDNLRKISKDESGRWRFQTKGIEYEFIRHEKEYCFTLSTSSEDPSKWTIEETENLSVCVEDWLELMEKEVEDPEYECEVYYTPVLPEDYNRIVPMLRQMNIPQDITINVTVWEFGDDYFHISVVNDSNEYKRNDAVFHNETCLGQYILKKTDIKSIPLTIERRIQTTNS